MVIVRVKANVRKGLGDDVHSNDIMCDVRVDDMICGMHADDVMRALLSVRLPA